MSTVLITGASGFIGRALSASMEEEHRVICMSRKDPELDLPWVKGEFGSFEDLQQLNDEAIDVVIHLAAVTGGCSERDAVIVNVEGTRCLMRYAMDRGCRKFVMASSIAAVGMQNEAFRPQILPIPDEHPCLDRNGYGLSKFLMEEITKFYARQNGDIDVINLRLSSVPHAGLPPLRNISPTRQWGLGSLTIMDLPDAVRVFALSAQSPHKPGVRIMNAAGPKAWVAVPVVEILRAWWGDEVDLSHFEQLGHEYDSVYDVSRIKEELGFVAERLPEHGGSDGR